MATVAAQERGKAPVKGPEKTPLPFDGFFIHNDFDCIRKFMLHIFEDRNDEPGRELARYLDVSIQPWDINGKDEGVCQISVDNYCKFQNQTEFRRSELVKIFDVF